MKSRRRSLLRTGMTGLMILSLTAAGVIPDSPITQAANHREAPITALDHKADIADFFAFVSYDRPDKVTFILTVDPLLEPANGPNYFPFDPDIRYAIKIDNNNDAIEDISFEFQFTTDIRLPGISRCLAPLPLRHDRNTIRKFGSSQRCLADSTAYQPRVSSNLR